ncbi:hypothetical protein M378DRAFT_80917 [Amanita muscaria Koide BX008]|uniref:C2H2-type domain-containing protein n=1 Tax=Amanita muscaria (strain Koide BX008) TaxID=946122 RepID=A0A0C2X0I8_AMAMK|nr:hypothetical protein M378DRAFT_80917 [Amanita muscaria Koide BX008]
MIAKVREQQDLQERAYTEWSGEGTSYYPLGVGASEGEGSNNGNRSTPAQAPAPVPNLTKKSRGRKVPYVAALRGGEGIGEGFPVSGILPTSRRGRRRAAVGGSAGTTSDGFQAQVPTGEDRSFVCVVPGCGKCFVRAEHLKRHVRSIHTEDKPFLCPYKGCGKSFSRRDNLGQHVRIHLND